MRVFQGDAGPAEQAGYVQGGMGERLRSVTLEPRNLKILTMGFIASSLLFLVILATLILFMFGGLGSWGMELPDFY